MRDLVQLVFEYRRLLAKDEATASSLRPPAAERLEALEKLFGQEPDADTTHPRRYARCTIRVPATVRVNGHVQPVTLLNVGGGGVCVSPAPNLKAGEMALLRLVGEDENKVYQYQVRESWTVRTDSVSMMGMPFVGIPRELSVDEEALQPRSYARPPSTPGPE